MAPTDQFQHKVVVVKYLEEPNCFFCVSGENLRSIAPSEIVRTLEAPVQIEELIEKAIARQVGPVIIIFVFYR